MPVKPETQEQLPLDGDAIQNVEDPGTVAEIFQKNAEQLKQEAAATLQYEEPDVPPEVVAGHAKIETTPGELPTEPEVKPAKKVAKPKEKVVAAPEVEPETPPEAKVSRREAFKAKAEADSTNRDREDRLKKREATVQAQTERAETILRELENDAYGYMEKKDPRFFEKLAERHIAGGKTPEKSETSALRAEVAEVRKEAKEAREEAAKTAELTGHQRSLNEGERLLSSADFDTVRDSAEAHEAFNGRPSDLRRALADVWIEYKQVHEKLLTPADCCEILQEDAQEHFDIQIPKFIDYLVEKHPSLLTDSDAVKKLFGRKPADPSLKKKTPPTGKTLTNAQETASAPAQELDPSQYKSKAELLKHVAGTLEYEEEETVV